MPEERTHTRAAGFRDPDGAGHHDLKILQPERGYKFSVDALLLADFARPKKGAMVLDLGTGCGVIALVMARNHPSIHVTAIEIQAGLAAIARENVKANGLEKRIQVVEGDINHARGILPAGSFDLVVTNPPYRPPATGRLCVEPEEAAARHEILTDLKRILAAARHALRPGGRICLVYPADRSVSLIASLHGIGMEPKRIRFVHPRAGARARLVLVEGMKDAGTELTVLPPLFLHDGGKG